MAIAEHKTYKWTPIGPGEIQKWELQLMGTSAHYRQYPYWCEPYRNTRLLRPNYFFWGCDESEQAYICLLEGRIGPVKFGLVQRGPVPLNGGSVDICHLKGLLRLAQNRGCAFLRFTHTDKHLCECILKLPGARPAESCAFYCDPARSLIVPQTESDTEMLGRFQAVARREIGYAEKAGYVIRSSDAKVDYLSVWPMFEKLANRKRFNLSHRSVDAWLDTVELAGKIGCSRLYTASIRGICVSAIHLLRYGSTVEFMLGALDSDLLKGEPSPSSLLHWRGMREFYRCGCTAYNLGGPGDGVRNKVYGFKRKFRPELRVAQPAVTVVLNAGVFRLWDILVVKGWLGSIRFSRALWARSKLAAGKLVNGFQPDEQNIPRGIEEKASCPHKQSDATHIGKHE